MTNDKTITCGRAIVLAKNIVIASESGRGLPHSKTLRAGGGGEETGISRVDGEVVVIRREGGYLENMKLRNEPKLKMRESSAFTDMKCLFLIKKRTQMKPNKANAKPVEANFYRYKANTKPKGRRIKNSD